MRLLLFNFHLNLILLTLLKIYNTFMSALSPSHIYFWFVLVSLLERMASLLPPEKTQLLVSVLPRREPFEILYRLNCDNLCADFKENLEFRFSWGITALISRFLGKEGHKLALNNYPSHVRTVVTPLLQAYSSLFAPSLCM